MSLLLTLLKRAGIGFLLLLVMLAIFLYWLLLTNSGLQASMALSRSVLPDTITFESVEGDLARQLRMHDLALSLEAMTIEVSELSLGWNPRLLRDGILKLESVRVEGVNVRVYESSAQEVGQPIALPAQLALPIDVQIDDLRMENVLIYQNDTTYEIDLLHARAEYIDSVFALIASSLRSEFADAELSGVVTTTGDYPLQLHLTSTLKQEFAMPVTGDVALFLDGSIRDFGMSGEAQIVGGRVPALSASYTGSVQTDPQNLLDYKLTGQVELTGDNIDTRNYVKELPGHVSVDAVVGISHHGGDVPAIVLSQLVLDGELLQEEIAVTGSGRWNGDAGEVNELRAVWGEYKAQLQGKIGPRSDLNWLAHLPDLAQAGELLDQDWRGKMTASGQLLGSLDAPRLIAQLEASSVSLAGTDIREAALDADLSLTDTLKFDLLLSDINVAGQTFDELNVALDGLANDHQLDLSLDAPHAEFVLVADAAIKDGGTLDAFEWTFGLSRLELIHADLNTSRPDHRWQLATVASGKINSTGFALDPVCLSHVLPGDGGGVCVDARSTPAGTAANIEVLKLGLMNLNSLLPADARVAGEVSGRAQWTGELATTVASLTLTDVGLSLQKNDKWLDVAEFAPGSFSVTPASDGSLGALALKVDLPLRDDSTKGLYFDVSAAIEGGTIGELSGGARAELPQLDWLAVFSEQVDAVTGSLVSNVDIGGTLSAPELFGVTQLDFPTISIANLGIDLLETQLTLEGTPQGMALTGSTHSGEGELTFDSNILLQESVEVSGRLTGENFIVSDSPEARVAVSPDLTATFADQMLTLRGDVGLPLARITLDKVPKGAVSASKDQQFLEQESSGAPLATDMLVRLLLGDEVTFEGLGLNASFGGALAIRDRSNQVTTAAGEIEVIEGTYQAYGQDLSIKNGKLVFAGGPVAEPGLDFRAVRQATPEIEVGVLVQGSLNQPTLDVFSTPSLPESDQLSYLVLGRPLSNSSASENSLFQQAAMALGVQGGQLLTEQLGSSLGIDSIGIESAPGTSNAQAALVVGKYLSPRLYVSYGYGLFEPISTLRLEYQLNRLWRIVTESTNTATGGDFLWVYER